MYTEDQLNAAEALLSQFLEAMPEITVDLQHPEMTGVSIESDHGYIKESFGNFLNSLESAEEVRQNTKLTLMYRDAGNHKKDINVVVPGAITDEQVKVIKENLQDGCMFIANEVGLPSPADLFKDHLSFPNEDDDHAFTTLVEFDDVTPAADSLLTDEPATVDINITVLTNSFTDMPGDIDAEMNRLYQFKTWDVDNVHRAAEYEGVHLTDGEAEALWIELKGSHSDSTLTEEIIRDAVIAAHGNKPGM